MPTRANMDIFTFNFVKYNNLSRGYNHEKGFHFQKIPPRPPPRIAWHLDRRHHMREHRTPSRLQTPMCQRKPSEHRKPLGQRKQPTKGHHHGKVAMCTCTECTPYFSDTLQYLHFRIFAKSSKLNSKNIILNTSLQDCTWIGQTKALLIISHEKLQLLKAFLNSPIKAI